MFQVALIFVKEETAITAEEGMGEWERPYPQRPPAPEQSSRWA